MTASCPCWHTEIWMLSIFFTLMTSLQNIYKHMFVVNYGWPLQLSLPMTSSLYNGMRTIHVGGLPNNWNRVIFLSEKETLKAVFRKTMIFFSASVHPIVSNHTSTVLVIQKWCYFYVISSLAELASRAPLAWRHISVKMSQIIRLFLENIVQFNNIYIIKCPHYRPFMRGIIREGGSLAQRIINASGASKSWCHLALLFKRSLRHEIMDCE